MRITEAIDSDKTSVFCGFTIQSEAAEKSSVFMNHRELNQRTYNRDNVCDKKASSPVIAIHLVKIIINACKDGEYCQQHSDD